MTTKSQFFADATGSGYTAGNFLLDSLTIVAADTRKGFDAQTSERVSAMTGFAAANPESSNAQRLGAYIAKLTPPAAETKPQATARTTVKLGNGLM